MTITALPAVPSRSDAPATFITKADAFLAALPQFATEANALAAGLNLASVSDTSATSNAIGTGAKTFTVSAGKSFAGGMYLIIADTAAPSTNSMFCQVTSYSGTTLIVNVISILGSGTKTAWTISLATAGGAPIASPTFTGNPAAPTPAQFDNDTSLATTEFVQRALGNIRGVSSSGGAVTLTAASAGFLVLCNVAGAVTLPLGSTLINGATFLFNAITAGTSIVRQGADSIFPGDASTLTSLNLSPGDTLMLTWLTGYGWAVSGGSAALRYAGGFKTALNAGGDAPVYACRAWVNFNGTGTVAIRASGNVTSITDNAVGDYTVNFTTALPDANYAVVPSISLAGGSGTKNIYINTIMATAAISAPTASACRLGTTQSGGTGTDNDYVNVSFFR